MLLVPYSLPRLESPVLGTGRRGLPAATLSSRSLEVKQRSSCPLPPAHLSGQGPQYEEWEGKFSWAECTDEMDLDKVIYSFSWH